jgi:DNA-binding NarL/FixJ family response regulator
MIRVLLADDQSLVRAGLKSLIEHVADLVVCGEAADGEAAIALTRSQRPDVVVMDVRMPGIDGLQATETIANDPDLAATKVIVLTTYELDEYLFRALTVGASGFLLKTVEPTELRRSIRLVHEGQALIDPAVTRRVIERFATTANTPVAYNTRLDVLTERERETVRLVAEGLSNDEVAIALYISPLTAKTHINRSMTKLAARDRAQLVVIAYQSGLMR